MKRYLILLAVALLAGSVAFCVTRSHKLAERKTVLLDAMPELAWVREELELTDDQFARIAALHAAYRPTCVEMCRRIADAQGRVEAAARGTRNMVPELEVAIREHAEIHAQCQEEMLKHLYETAALLEEEQADRYLETMLPFGLDSTPIETGDRHSR